MQGLAHAGPDEKTEVNWPILGGGLVFVVLSIVLGTSEVAYAQEIVFVSSLSVILYLIRELVKKIPPEAARVLIGTATIIFVFRAVPLPGPGLTWFEIDDLGFDERFLSILSLITSLLTLVGTCCFAAFDGGSVDCIHRGATDDRRGRAVAAQHRSLLWDTGMDGCTYRRNCGRAVHCHSRYSD